MVPSFPGADMQRPDRSKMLGDVSLLQYRMQFWLRLKEYKTLLQKMGLALFKNPADEVESMIKMIDRKQMVYKTTAEVDQTDKNHQVTVNTVSELKKSPDKRGTRPVHPSTWGSGKSKLNI
jgi:hypothetical protein